VTAYSKTISNGIGIVAVGPADAWGAYNWNAFKWGEGTVDFGSSVSKGVDNTPTMSSSLNFQEMHLVDVTPTFDTSMGFMAFHSVDSSFSLDNSMGMIPYIGISLTLSFASETVSETLYNGNWAYVMPNNTTNFEDKTSTTWAAASTTAPTWTAVTPASTTWS